MRNKKRKRRKDGNDMRERESIASVTVWFSLKILHSNLFQRQDEDKKGKDDVETNTIKRGKTKYYYYSRNAIAETEKGMSVGLCLRERERLS